MKKVVFLLLLIHFLVVLPAAHAEDSWVLWEKIEHTEIDSKGSSALPIVWDILDGFAKEADCKARRMEIWDSHMKYWNEKLQGSPTKAEGTPYEAIHLIFKDKSAERTTTFTYHCLPATTDPRK